MVKDILVFNITGNNKTVVVIPTLMC